MKTTILLLLVTLQILLPAPGCRSSRDTWPEHERDTTGDNPGDPNLSQAELCIMLRCQRLRDDGLRKACKRKCLSFDDAPRPEVARDEDEACLRGNCAGRRGPALKACALARCGLEPRSRRIPPARRLAAKRMKGMWPDEFETRMAERAMWPDEYETRNVRRRGGEEDPRREELGATREDEHGTRALVRRARSEETEPVSVRADQGGVVKSVQKRWSTRLCMESHCKNAHGKVQYFMCGKAYCHR